MSACSGGSKLRGVIRRWGDARRSLLWPLALLIALLGTAVPRARGQSAAEIQQLDSAIRLNPNPHQRKCSGHRSIAARGRQFLRQLFQDDSRLCPIQPASSANQVGQKAAILGDVRIPLPAAHSAVA